MNRRRFVGTVLAAAAVSARSRSMAAAPNGAPPAPISRIGRFSLKELRDQYRFYLFDDFLPFMEKCVIDTELGGFLWNTGGATAA